MNNIERARMVGLTLTGLLLLAVACVYAQSAVWPVAALLGVGTIVCADAALNVQEKARELHAATHRDLATDWAEVQASVRAALADEMVFAPTSTTVHACPPDGSGLMPCCGRTPFELGALERLTEHGPAVTCPGTQEADRA
ncbi:hypothetical protein K1Y80_02350 [Streptomyces sp. MAG02]|nr:hypothetical protein [Streptomyces sp. MAG02]